MDFNEAKNFILKRMGEELPQNLFYHGLHHTLDVCNAVEKIAKSENVNGESLILLKTAAVFHDCGFIKQYMNNEPLAVGIAQNYLPQFNYTEHQINTIADIILCTQIQKKKKNHIEEIMCDADLDYLGRDDFFKISETLKREWLAYGLVSSEEEYNQKQVKFFEEHNYFTKTAKALREPKKHKHLLELKKRL